MWIATPSLSRRRCPRVISARFFSNQIFIADKFLLVTVMPLSGLVISPPSAVPQHPPRHLRLVNDALLAAGKKPLGFLNPWLYSGAYKTFTDVTIGSSFGCNSSGFPATEGWDAVTGFGTPVSAGANKSRIVEKMVFQRASFFVGRLLILVSFRTSPR